MKPSSAPSCSATMTRASRRREAPEPGDDVARAGRVALVGEQRGDRLGVVALGGAEGGRGLSVMRAMVPGRDTDQEPMRTA